MNWRSVLANQKIEVLYNHPVFGVSDPKNEMDLALLKLPFNRHIEVRWDDDQDSYVVDLFGNDFRIHLAEKTAATSSEAIEAVKQMAQSPCILEGESESSPMLAVLNRAGYRIASIS